MNNIYVLNKNYSKIGTLSNQGANPQAPYYEDLFVQELETGADTYQFSTTSSKYTQDILEIGNHIMFTYKNRNELFTITSLEYSHNEGYKTIGVYAEGIGFDLLEVYMKRPENEKESSSGGSSGGSSSGSGGSSSGGGNDSDGDGDDNTDNEYADPDDVYIDENGNIIYDKYGQDDYADPDNVSIDGDGNIIYRRSKRNRKNDSLEFKNISYSRFLSILLKNTGWSYVCQPGLESIKHDITVRYDTNIFALLQDSMQSYRGVELEFVHELVGGRVQKVIKAYKDGGRGSFIGKRFEYGKNVRGITKTQEVTDSEDDTILYVDNVGINVQYDVDFALKSAEVPEIEIGDTHYVIDNDFCPPMQIKARIGKIEISFSDPTVNKIYLANNKRISGSAVENEFGADDVADMLDDYEYGDNGAAYDHYHDRLICDNVKTHVSEDGKTQGTTRWQTSVELSEDKLLPAKADSYYLGDEYTPWRDIFTKYVTCNDMVITPSIRAYDYNVNFDRIDMQNVEEVTNKQELLDFIVNNINIYEYSAIEMDDIMNAPENHAYQIYYGILAEDFVNHGDECTVTDPVARRIMKGLVMTDTDNDGSMESEDGHNRHTYNVSALLTALIGAFQHYVNGNSPNAPSDPDDPSNPGSGSYDKLIVDRLEAEVVEATGYVGEVMQLSYFIQVPELIANEIMHTTRIVVDECWDEGSPEIVVARGYYDSGYIDDPTTTIGTKITPDGITFPDGSTLTTANGSGGGTSGCIFEKVTTNEGKSYYYTDNSLYIQNDLEVSGALILHDDGEGTSANSGTVDCDTLKVVEIEFHDGTTMTTAGGSGGGNTFDTITVRKIQGPDPGEGQYNCVEFADAIKVGHIWSVYGTSIDFQDHLNLHNGLSIEGDLQVDGNILPNEVHTSKVVFPDGTSITTANSVAAVSADLSEYATVEALHEEIRAKDEQIASLEARLAAIEAMLDINND